MMMTERRSAAVSMRWLSGFVVFLLFFSPCFETEETHISRNCLDYNTLSKYGTSVGIPEKQLFFCPSNDSIAGNKCSGKLPVKANLTEVITPSRPLTWKDVVVYLMYGKDFKGREKVLDWWIVLFALDFPLDRLDLVMIGPSCGTAVTCTDGASYLANHINETYKNNIAIHFMRGRPPDDGRSRLACKALYSMIKMYEQFPDKQYFLKIDDDTVWFPNRFFRFVQTLDRIHEANLPMYFGSVLNGHKPVELCGPFGGPVIMREPPYNRLDDKIQRENRRFSFDVCYAGGAGYGMNRQALAAFLNTTLCTTEMDLEYDDEDGWVGFWLYKKLQVQVIHCGSFRPHWYHHELWYDRAINYHRVSSAHFFPQYLVFHFPMNLTYSFTYPLLHSFTWSFRSTTILSIQ